MIFNSIEFFVLMAVVLPIYFCVNHRAQNLLLLVASYVFYGFWDWRFLSLILISTIVDYSLGLALGRTDAPSRRKQLVLASLVVNLGILGFFKYAGFFVHSFAELLEALGFTVHLPTLNLLLPVGISFYTFQTLSYTVDIYRKRLEPTSNFLDFALFVAFFPQLVAGPIERAKRLLPILATPRRVNWKCIAIGLELILIGFFKKVGVADTLAPIVDSRFFEPQFAGGADLLLASYLFSIQIYCDFSGYSDIARGTARLFGIRLCRNFEQPYLSSNITEFWRRWHISLSSWLRDYLYISLGGNRISRFRTYANLMLTMLLGGLWHGANWTFVVWGGIHGVYLVAHKLFLELRASGRAISGTSIIAKLALIFLTFNLVTLTWIFFRSESLQQAIEIISNIMTWSSADPQWSTMSWFSPRILILIAGVIVIDLIQYRTKHHAAIVGYPLHYRVVAYSALIIVTVVLGNLSQDVPFIYFQF